MSKNTTKKTQTAGQANQPTAKTKIKRLVKDNKSRVLSVAVALAVGTALTSCTRNEDSYYRQGAYTGTSSEVDGSYNNYSGGYHYFGSYYYGRGANYRSGSWGTAGDGSYIGGGYSTHGGGTDGIGA